MEKNLKKTLFISGAVLCGLFISGLPTYYISTLSRPISRQAVFYLTWGLFGIPFGAVFLLYLILWYKEK